MNLLDCFAAGLVVGALFWHERAMHAPSSRDVRTAVFRSSDGSCYTLEPVVVRC